MNKTQLTKVIPRAVTKISRCRVDTTIRRGLAREEAEEIPGPPPPPPPPLNSELKQRGRRRQRQRQRQEGNRLH